MNATSLNHHVMACNTTYTKVKQVLILVDHDSRGSRVVRHCQNASTNVLNWQLVQYVPQGVVARWGIDIVKRLEHDIDRG